jgi:hypothetical protein
VTKSPTIFSGGGSVYSYEAEYLDSTLKLVDVAYSAVLEEAKND